MPPRTYDPKPETVQVDLAQSVHIDSADTVKLSYGDGANAPDGSADRPITVRLSPASEDPKGTFGGRAVERDRAQHTASVIPTLPTLHG